MATPKVGSGFIYAKSFRDSEGNYLDGGKNYYKVTLPNPVPATDNKTRPGIKTPKRSFFMAKR
jgi:hypothetical protein